MKKNKLNIGCLIYTHERVDDARINMEIIRSLWNSSDQFSDLKIIHSFNGKKSWYPKKYIEDNLVRLSNNPGHYQGASELIDAGILKFQKIYPKIRYVVVLASDTWCTNPRYIAKIIHQMKKNNRVLATCPWGLPLRFKESKVGMATDFFIIDIQWSKKYKFFPLQYSKFSDKYQELLSYLQPGSNVSLEKLFLTRFYEASFREHNDNVHRRELAQRSIHLLQERIPVHTDKNKKGYWIRKFYWPQIGLITHHQPEIKQKIIRKVKGVSGQYANKLVKAKNLKYYNNGKIKRPSFD